MPKHDVELVVKIYLTNGCSILTAFSDLDWKYSGGEITSMSVGYLDPDRIEHYANEFPDFEFLRLDLINIKDIVAVSIIQTSMDETLENAEAEVEFEKEKEGQEEE